MNNGDERIRERFPDDDRGTETYDLQGVLYLSQRPRRPERPVSGDGAQPVEELPALSGDSKLTTWVYRIAMNTCITFLRRTNARPQTVPMTANVAQLEADEDTTGQLRELYRLINQLGKLERALILLWLEERSYEEIADILGITKTNVAVKLNRTKEKLKKMSNR